MDVKYSVIPDVNGLQLLGETAISAFSFIVQNKLSSITLKCSAALVLWYCHLAKADGEK
jgi:hypothetical protein